MYGGMLYFPLKVNLFEEIAVELVEAKFGLKGTAAVMKLLCKIHKENGYYLKWNAEQCTLFTNKAGKDINEQEMQGIVDILVEKAFFDPKTYKEQGVLTSTEIQKVWLEATKRRKRDLTTPENRMMLRAIMPMNWASPASWNWSPRPSLPNSMPTNKKTSNVGIPNRYPVLLTTILTNNRMEPIKRMFSALNIILL